MDKTLEKVYQQNADGTYSYDPSQSRNSSWGELVALQRYNRRDFSRRDRSERLPMKDQDFRQDHVI